VIIPTFNRARMVCDAIDSVLAQTMREFEVIVVDDGSTDDTAAVIRSRYAGEPRVRYFTKENGGTGRARDHGLGHARGEYVALLDDDDLWLPRHLESQVACLDAHADVDLVVCDARLEGAKRTGTIFGHRGYRLPDSVEAMAQSAWAVPTTIVMRTDVARAVGFRSEFRQTEDTDFLWRFTLAGYRLRANPKVLTVYRCHNGGGSPRKSHQWEAFKLDQVRVMEHYLAAAGRPRHMVRAIHRLRAALCAHRGEWRQARHHYWNWWRRKPDSSKALRGLFRSVFGRR
jgi:glycosyltransferase involved in cell wall biosynthesis